MTSLTSILKGKLQFFGYFHQKLRYRIFLVIIISIVVGLLDGFGMAMFLPLLQMINESSGVDSDGLGNLRFILDALESFGIGLTLINVLLVMLFFFTLKGIAWFLQGVYQVWVQQFFIKKIRVENVFALNKIAFKSFVQSDVGQIQNTLTGEVERVSKANDMYFTALQQGIMVSVYMGFALFVDWKFAVLVGVGGGLTNFVYSKIHKKTKAHSSALTRQANLFQGLIIQYVSSFKYLKATGSLDLYSQKLVKSIDIMVYRSLRIGRLVSFVKASREPLIMLVVTLVILLQTRVLGSPLGPIIVSLLFLYRALSNLMQVQSAWNNFLAVSGSLENMTEFERMLLKNTETLIGNISIDSINTIALKQVCFSYGKKDVLRSIDLFIDQNKTIAFVGESGSGKTTIVNLCAGLMPIDRGVIEINGEDIKKLRIRDLQGRIGYITQDSTIFNDTIFNNITFWADNTPENVLRFEKAIENSALTSFVNDLEKKENTLLGYNGVNLSGGQKQRISIARELYKDVDILILDEATSALDSETEMEIQRNVDSLKGKYTLLIVAHRLSTIKNADAIVHMHNGQILGVGAFDKLEVMSPQFRKMVELQGIKS